MIFLKSLKDTLPTGHSNISLLQKVRLKTYEKIVSGWTFPRECMSNYLWSKSFYFKIFNSLQCRPIIYIMQWNPLIDKWNFKEIHKIETHFSCLLLDSKKKKNYNQIAPTVSKCLLSIPVLTPSWISNKHLWTKLGATLSNSRVKALLRWLDIDYVSKTAHVNQGMFPLPSQTQSATLGL